ncbi:MAG TPA: sugar phosphate isomerase/epimerase family protein [Novosphingobium sp.]|nr:sugar phosphate isomerase/epimerase family protein [Novosphingobium sp.]
MKGPAIFLAQFAGDTPPFDTLDSITKYMSGLGYKGVQIPTWDARLFDLRRAAESQDYVDEVIGICAANGVQVTELSTHLQGQLVATHPAYDVLFDGFAPPELHGNAAARAEWAVDQLKLAALASRRFGCRAHATFSGALMWHMVYPWPQRPAGLVEEGFAELARRWRPILDAFDENGVDACFELHPGEDLHDGVTFERFLAAVDGHPRANILYDPSHFVLQQLDYLEFIEFYHDRIKAFHVKDAEFRPNGKAGVYGSYSGWTDRPGRFRSLGDGQIDFSSVFTRLTHHGYDGWAVLEWECAYKHPEQGAAEGAPFIARHMIRKAYKAFDDFAGGASNRNFVRSVLGLRDLTT